MGDFMKFLIVALVILFSGAPVFAAPKTNCTEQSMILNVVYRSDFVKHGGVFSKCNGIFSEDPNTGELKFSCVDKGGVRYYYDMKFEPGRVTGKWNEFGDWGFVDFYFANECKEILGVTTWIGGAGSWSSQKVDENP
jgi:hypothetical protein